MREASRDGFERLPIFSLRLLEDAPLHTLHCLELPGGRPGMSIPEIVEVVGLTASDAELGALTRGLVGFRTWLGRKLRWGDEQTPLEPRSYLHRLSAEERERSLIPSGTIEGYNRVLYCDEGELLGEIINGTVHCFWAMVREPIPGGYRFYQAVWVKHQNWFSPIYMAVVTPILKWIIYPSVLRGLERHWKIAFPAAE